MIQESYIERVRREIAERRAKRGKEAALGRLDPRATLKAQIAEWYRLRSPEAYAPHYLMEELVTQLRAQPQQLGLALRELGWECKRVWRKRAAYRHHWFPPDSDFDLEEEQRSK